MPCIKLVSSRVTCTTVKGCIGSDYDLSMARPSPASAYRYKMNCNK